MPVVAALSTSPVANWWLRSAMHACSRSMLRYAPQSWGWHAFIATTVVFMLHHMCAAHHVTSWTLDSSLWSRVDTHDLMSSEPALRLAQLPHLKISRASDSCSAVVEAILPSVQLRPPG